VLAILEADTGRALWAVRPAQTGHGVDTGLLVSEVSDCICKGFDFIFHGKPRISQI
jgi:hypothetical protein